MTSSPKTIRIARDLALPLDIVTEALGIVATRGAGKSYTSAVFLEEAHRAGVPFVVLDPSGAYWGLRSNADGDGPGVPCYVLGGEHGDLPLEPGAAPLLADLVVDSGHSFVLDLSDLSGKAMRTFVAEFLDRLFDRKARNRTTLLVVIDEADEFAPQLIRGRGEAPASLSAVERVTKRGRRRGLGVILITQRTQALNKDVLDLIETLIAMRQLAERSRDAVEGWIADKQLRDDAGVIQSLQSLPTGEAWVWSPLRGILQRVKVRRIRTFDSYKTPEPGEAPIEPAKRAELDLDALGERMRATVERAKENDPADLRRRLRDAEALARHQAEEIDQMAREEVETREVVVEVPVLPPALVKAFEPLRAAVDDIATSFSGTIGPAVDALAAYTAALDAAAKSGREKVPERATAPARQPERVRTPPAQPAPPAVGAATAPRSDLNGDAKIGKGERKVLEVLAAYPEGKTQNEVAFLTGYSARASTIAARISNLRKLGYVYPTQPVRLTPEGMEAAGGQRRLPTGPDLLDHWLGHPRVGEGERRVLLALIDAYPNALSTGELADRTGYSANASTIAARISNLRKLGLVEKRGNRIVDEFYEAIR